MFLSQLIPCCAQIIYLNSFNILGDKIILQNLEQNQMYSTLFNRLFLFLIPWRNLLRLKNVGPTYCSNSFKPAFRLRGPAEMNYSKATTPDREVDG